ncbi:MAG TPA: non-lysosomal glucosylceramidase [Candidatus Acidoferrales bacterium]|nr:non-lysosomal glucosylceramidase [Candidatus Acidoferrales bacterium]
MRARHWIAVAFVFLFVGSMLAGDNIPKAAWKRGIGVPLENAGTRKPELVTMIDDGYWQGAPVGGFGAGTFSRTYRGDFARWHMKAGVHKYQSVWANQFAMFQQVEGSHAVAKVLTAATPNGGDLSAWNWNYPVGAGDYYALYPKSWVDYRDPEFPAHVVLEQFSPILPDNYKETSYPVAVFRWHAENPTSKPVTVSVMFSWTNMVGWFRDYSSNVSGHLDMGNVNRFQKDPDGVQGLLLDRVRHADVSEEWDGQFALVADQAPGVEISHFTTFLTENNDGKNVWGPFAQNGALANGDQHWASTGEALAGAIAVKFTLKPGEKRVIPMVLAWDFPIVQFGEGRKWYRKYTDFYGKSGTNAWTIAKDALRNAAAWSDAIDAWQKPYIEDESKPLWYRGMLFNELYALADGGSFWGKPVDAKPDTPDTYSFMECFDYPYYATLDVLFYGSMPLAKFWPEIDKQVMRDFAATVPQTSSEDVIWRWKTLQTGEPVSRQRKVYGAVPHDLGVPQEDPFVAINQFSWQNTNRWKDLNSKFVLMVYRDYALTGKKDVAFLEQTWPAVQQALQYLEQFDTDHSGLPKNEAYPDQTYDEWTVKGNSAYCGGLYLAALRAGEEIARKLGDQSTAQRYRQMFNRGQLTYVSKLWNGSYFRYDTEGQNSNDVQSEQLAGQWYANLTGLGDIVPPEMRRSALKRVFEFNVMKAQDGSLGAFNGWSADGTPLTTNQQTQEVWTGTTFGVASHMLSEGLREEAFKTAWGVYNVVYEKKGFWFRTPEAYDARGNFRASMYMRPGAIWAMEMVKAPQQQAAK